MDESERARDADAVEDPLGGGAAAPRRALHVALPLEAAVVAGEVDPAYGLDLGAAEQRVLARPVRAVRAARPLVVGPVHAREVAVERGGDAGERLLEHRHPLHRLVLVGAL